jgi:hypothetical protein
MENYFISTVLIISSLRLVTGQTESLSVPVWAIGVVAGVVGLLLLVALIAVIFVCGWYAKKVHIRRNTRSPHVRRHQKDLALIGNEELDNPSLKMGPVPSPTMSDIAPSQVTKSSSQFALNEISRGNVCLKHQLGTCEYGTIWDAEVVLGPKFASRALVKVCVYRIRVHVLTISKYIL